MKNLIVVLIILLFLSVSCGKEENSGSKSLFSSWSASTGYVLDLTSGHMGTFAILLVKPGGEQCVANVTMGGTESAGSSLIFGSTYVNGTGGGTDPGCSASNASYTFTKSGAVLSICPQTGACVEYR